MIEETTDASSEPSPSESNHHGEPAAAALSVEAIKVLRRLMHERGLTQRDLAQQLKFSETSVSRWFTRQQGMPLSTLQKVADALGVTLSAILVPGAPPAGDPVGLARQLIEQELAPNGWRDYTAQSKTWRMGADARLRAIERAQEELRHAQEEIRRSLRRVPIYHQGHRGDPRVGEEHPEAALVYAYAQLPPGITTRTVGVRGFAVLVNTGVVAARAVRRGDVVFVNPDAPYEAGALVVVGANYAGARAGAAPPEGQPRAITLRVLAYGGGLHQGALVARVAPETPWPDAIELGPTEFVVYGPVVVHTAITRLVEGQGHPSTLRRTRTQNPPADAPEDAEPGTPLEPPASGGGGGESKHYTIGPDGRPISYLDDVPPVRVAP